MRTDTSSGLDFLRWSRQITGVSILRAGETMEQALMAVCKDIRLGKILIQTNHDTGEPEVPHPFLHAHSLLMFRQNSAARTWKCLLKHRCFFFPSLLQLHYLRLPKDISEDYVILMDSTVSTGAAALMAVRVLLVCPTRISSYTPPKNQLTLCHCCQPQSDSTASIQSLIYMDVFVWLGLEFEFWNLF